MGQLRLSLALSTDHTSLATLEFAALGKSSLGEGHGQLEGLGATSQGWVCLHVAVWLFCQGMLPVK